MITNNYYAITLDDYQVLKDLAPLKRYNHVAVLSEQVVEKKPEDCSTGQHTDHNIEYWIFQHLFPILIHYLLFRFPIFISYGFSCIKSIRYKSFRHFSMKKAPPHIITMKAIPSILNAYNTPSLPMSALATGGINTELIP